MSVLTCVCLMAGGLLVVTLTDFSHDFPQSQRARRVTYTNESKNIRNWKRNSKFRRNTKSTDMSSMKRTKMNKTFNTCADLSYRKMSLIDVEFKKRFYDNKFGFACSVCE